MAKKKVIRQKTVKIRARHGKMWLSKVEPGNRLELPLALADEVDWLSTEQGTTIPAVIFPLDELNGVQLFSPEPGIPGSKEELERDFDKVIDQVAADVSLTEEELRQLQRLLANRWAVSVEVRSQSFRITLPRQARKLKLLPDHPGVIVIFTPSEDDRVELWEDSQWLRNLRASKSLLSEKIEEYFDDVVHQAQIKTTTRKSK